VREWLVNQRAGGYVEYDAGTDRFALPEEHAAALAAEGHRAFLAGAFRLAALLAGAEPRASQAFRTGRGLAPEDYEEGLLDALDRSSRAKYAAHLTSWIAAIPPLRARLEEGAIVADVGCGGGAATRLLAEAFPRSRFVGFDSHAPSVERARRTAEGLGDRLRFELASAEALPGQFDLVACFESLHEMADPAAAARGLARALAPGGCCLIVEPPAGDGVEANAGTLGRLLSSLSVLLCRPLSGGEGLGALAGERRIREVLAAAGLGVRRVAETPFCLVLEARPE
jgi:SAM-dependent methyltransferase